MMSTLLKNWDMSPFPTLNVHRRDESVASDTIYLDTPAVDSGATIAQVFVGAACLVTNMFMPLRLIGNSSTLLRTKSRLEELPLS